MVQLSAGPRDAYIGVPVKLSKTTWLERDKGGSDGLGRREVGRVNFVEAATFTRHFFTRVLQGVVNKAGVSSELTTAASSNSTVRDCAVDDVGISGR